MQKTRSLQISVLSRSLQRLYLEHESRPVEEEGEIEGEVKHEKEREDEELTSLLPILVPHRDSTSRGASHLDCIWGSKIFAVLLIDRQTNEGVILGADGSRQILIGRIPSCPPSESDSPDTYMSSRDRIPNLPLIKPVSLIPSQWLVKFHPPPSGFTLARMGGDTKGSRSRPEKLKIDTYNQSI